LGKIGCFSLQQGKHVTSGEGGLIVTNDDALARRISLFINKAWGYGDSNPDHEFLALNYRMSELQAAVAVAQLSGLENAVAKRIAAARELDKRLAGLPGIETPHIEPHTVHTFWRYCLRVNNNIVPGGCDALGIKLRAKNISCMPRYIQKPAFLCKLFQDKKTFGNSSFPFTLARPEVLQYDEDRFLHTYQALRQILVLPWNENYLEQHIEFIAQAIYEATDEIGR
jgi:dTDP-4-amino-4,6-dideoxygalactose transaminase